MPYIAPNKRDCAPFFDRLPETAGELNFVFTIIADKYISAEGLSYDVINEIMGALEGCKLEMYRRVAQGYEDSKIQEHGDVYSRRRSLPNGNNHIEQHGDGDYLPETNDQGC